MVKDHARKNAIHEHMRAHGGTYTAAAAAIDAPHTGAELVLMVDYPTPVLERADPCPTCSGSGMSGDLFEQPGDGRPPLLVGTVCPACIGCGRAGHDDCPPGAHAVDDPDAGDLEDFDLDDEPGPTCPSCHGRRFWYLAADTGGDEHTAAADAELRERATAASVSAWDLAATAQLGELDELLGAGAQALAQKADTTVYVKMPCGCAEDLIHTAHR